MGSKIRLLILALAVIAIGHGCESRAVHPSAAVADDSGDIESNNVETSTPNEAEEWLKVTLAPEPHMQHKLGTPLDLECEIMGTPPPKVKWIRGSYSANAQFDELDSNVITEGSGIARVRARLVLDHIPTVGDHHFTCIGQLGGQVVHASTTVKTVAGDLFPSSGINVRHRPVMPGVEMLNHMGLTGPAGPVAPRITKWFNVLLENIGNTVVLPCGAYAQPSPQVYWLDNNDNLISKRDPRFIVDSDGSLVILNLKWDDMGEFHCVAKNDLGKDTKGTFIYPMLKD